MFSCFTNWKTKTMPELLLFYIRSSPINTSNRTDAKSTCVHEIYLHIVYAYMRASKTRETGE